MKKIIIFLVGIMLIISFLTSNIYAISVTTSKSTFVKNTQSLLAPPYPASNPTPANNSINVELNIMLSWIGGDPDGDPISYNIFFGITPNPPNVELVYRANTYDPGLLEYNTQYYWRIDTYADNGGATTGPLWTFTTKDDTPPYPPHDPSPGDNAIDVPRNITLSWIGGDPNGDPVTYDIYFGSDSTPPNVALDYNNTTYTPESLEYNTQYYWRINATDEYGYTTIGPLWTFTTKDDTQPNTPSDPIPDNQSTNISVDITLRWSGGDPDNDPVTYNIYLGTTPNPPLEAENLSDNSYTTPGLDFITQYYWKVEATDEYGYTTMGPLWTFTTRENAPPYVPSEPIPENESTNVYIDAILSWQGGDPDSDPVTYDVYFGTTPLPPKVESNISLTTYEPAEMNITTTYYWKIVAWDNHSNSASSPLWNFKTSIYKNSPPEKPSRPTGPTTGSPGISYTYSTSTTDSNGEPIYYTFDWDDGTTSGWLGPYNSGQTVTTSHVWLAKGSYAVKVKAKDIYGGESFWSDPLVISMPKNHAKTLLSSLLHFFENYDVFLHSSLVRLLKT